MTVYLSRIYRSGHGEPDLAVYLISATVASITGTPTGSKFLRDDWSWQPPTASAAATTIEQDLGAAACSGKFTITDASISPSSKVLVWQAPGPYTNKGTLADEAAMQPVQVIAVEPGTGSAVVHWQTPPLITMSPVVNDSPRRNNVGATFDRLANQRWPTTFTPKRLGRVQGNVKFSYTVLV